jgi:hypothetical protein
MTTPNTHQEAKNGCASRVSPNQIVKKITRSLKLNQPIKKKDKTRKSKRSKSEIPRRVLKTKIKDVPGTSIESDPSTEDHLKKITSQKKMRKKKCLAKCQTHSLRSQGLEQT